MSKYEDFFFKVVRKLEEYAHAESPESFKTF